MTPYSLHPRFLVLLLAVIFLLLSACGKQPELNKMESRSAFGILAIPGPAIQRCVTRMEENRKLAALLQEIRTLVAAFLAELKALLALLEGTPSDQDILDIRARFLKGKETLIKAIGAPQFKTIMSPSSLNFGPGHFEDYLCNAADPKGTTEECRVKRVDPTVSRAQYLEYAIDSLKSIIASI